MIKLNVPHKYLLERLDAPEGMRISGIGPSLSKKDTVEIFLIGDGTHEVTEKGINAD